MIKNPVVSPIVDPVQLVISSLESLKNSAAMYYKKLLLIQYLAANSISFLAKIINFCIGL